MNHRPPYFPPSPPPSLFSRLLPAALFWCLFPSPSASRLSCSSGLIAWWAFSFQLAFMTLLPLPRNSLPLLRSIPTHRLQHQMASQECCPGASCTQPNRSRSVRSKLHLDISMHTVILNIFVLSLLFGLIVAITLEGDLLDLLLIFLFFAGHYTFKLYAIHITA